MIEIKPFVSLPLPAASRTVATRTVRKVAMCGSHSESLVDAPWTDPSWEFWGHSSARAWYRRPMDRYFDLHVKACWSRGGKKSAGYPRWLAKNTIPIYMQDRDPDVPASIRFPKGQILQEFGDSRPYFTNHLAWMIAMAMTEGVNVIGLWGINYGIESEYVRQRGSAEYWLGRAAERGVRIVLPAQCTLLRDPVLLYGYESHDKETGALLPAYKALDWVGTIKPVPSVLPNMLAKPPKEIVRDIELEEEDYPRPEWARPENIGRCDRTDGEAQEA